MEVALDTNAYSDWVRKGLWRNTISHATHLWLPAVVIGELYRGFYHGQRFQENESLLLELLAQASVGVIDIDRNVARIYGELLHYLQEQGKPIPVNDIWIAASCVAKGCTLLTRDKHFENLPQVRVRGSGAEILGSDWVNEG